MGFAFEYGTVDLVRWCQKITGFIGWDDAGSSTEEGGVIPTESQGIHTMFGLNNQRNQTLVDSSFVVAWKALKS